MIRFGILGFGAHGDRRLMPGFARATRSRVTAISRRSLAKAQASAERYGIAHAFDSKQALCAAPDVDAILIATPNHEHCADTLLALKAGKPVLCEKPLALNAGEAETMVRAARESGLKFGVAQIFRFEASVNRMRERIAAGDLGRPVTARAEFHYWGLGHPRTWLLQKAISGGGPVADVGVHCLDALRYILRDEVSAIAALGRADEHSGEVEAAAALSLRFASGCLGAVLVSLRAQYRSPVEIVGEEATLRAEDGLTVDHPVTLELWRKGACVERETLDNSDAYARQTDAFAAWLEDGAPFPAPGDEGWKNQLILDAAYDSMRTGKTVQLGSAP